MVMRVRYALRISVDDATEETPRAAYRSGFSAGEACGAAGMVKRGRGCRLFLCREGAVCHVTREVTKGGARGRRSRRR